MSVKKYQLFSIIAYRLTGGMCFHVAVQRRLDRERAVADITIIWLFPRMYSYMPNKIAGLLETFITVLALMGVFSTRFIILLDLLILDRTDAIFLHS